MAITAIPEVGILKTATGGLALISSLTVSISVVSSTLVRRAFFDTESSQKSQSAVSMFAVGSSDLSTAQIIH